MDNTKQVKRQEITEIAKRLSDEEKQKIKNEFTAQSVEGLPYSEGNIDLLYLQEGLPGTYGTFNQWKAHGYKVKNGEHGKFIFRPITEKIKYTNGEVDEKLQKCIRFIVFHETQVRKESN